MIQIILLERTHESRQRNFEGLVVFARTLEGVGTVTVEVSVEDAFGKEPAPGVDVFIAVHSDTEGARRVRSALPDSWKHARVAVYSSGQATLDLARKFLLDPSYGNLEALRTAILQIHRRFHGAEIWRDYYFPAAQVSIALELSRTPETLQACISSYERLAVKARGLEFIQDGLADELEGTMSELATATANLEPALERLAAIAASPDASEKSPAASNG